jgi:chemotaxis response regulator CheB
MTLRLVPKNAIRADERLGRLNQQAERFVQSSEQPIESLIVMGASAGGYVALQDAVKGLSHDSPAAVIILLHSGRRTTPDFSMKSFLSSSTDLHIQVAQTEGGYRLDGCM